MKIDHIGYAVRNMDKALDSFQQLGFVFEPIIDDIDRNVRICFGEKDGYKIELICPLDGKKSSPVDQYLANALGTPYHICYLTDHLDKEIERFKKQGFKVIISPSPAIAFQNRRVVFMMSLGFGLMELVEKKREEILNG